MILQITASKDSYITNKIIDSKTRVTDANVGYASTIDLFKLYNESSISGEDTPIELSRGLIKIQSFRIFVIAKRQSVYGRFKF